MRYTFLIRILILGIFFSIYALKAQNELKIQFSLGHGNTNWKYSELKLAETTAAGDTLNVHDLKIHANSPTFVGSIILDYRLPRFALGFGFSIQHYFINEFITDAIYFETSNIYIPVTTSPYNHPQPTHFKFYPYLEYSIFDNEKLDIYISAYGGTYLTSSMTVDSLEGVHWFINTSLGIKYLLNKKWTFIVSPAFDYSRVNFDFDATNFSNKPYLNIYSIYTSLGIKYHLYANKLSHK